MVYPLSTGHFIPSWIFPSGGWFWFYLRKITLSEEELGSNPDQRWGLKGWSLKSPSKGDTCNVVNFFKPKLKQMIEHLVACLNFHGPAPSCQSAFLLERHSYWTITWSRSRAFLRLTLDNVSQPFIFLPFSLIFHSVLTLPPFPSAIRTPLELFP